MVMKRFVVYLGPDTIGITARSKDHIKRKLSKLIKKTPKRVDHLGYTFKGRKYCYNEINEVVIMTLDNFFKSISNI